MNAIAFFSYLRIPIAATASIAASLGGLLYWKQNEIIYPRNVPLNARTEVPRPKDFPDYTFSSTEELTIPTPDGEALSAFLLKPTNMVYAKRAPITIIMFHGNAGNIGHRLPVAGVLDQFVDVNILMVEYRGYGLSTGRPDEKGLNIDGQTALDYVRERKDLSGSKIVVYGQSLGGAVSIQLVARNLEQGDIAALILENTFTSIRKLIPTAFPPARFIAYLCHQIWPSEETLPKITTIPILFLSGLKDEIVPASHMKQLYTVSRANPKIFRSYPEGAHNNTVAAPGYFQHIADFIEEYVLKAPDSDS